MRTGIGRAQGRRTAYDLTPHEKCLMDLMEETGLCAHQLMTQLGMPSIGSTIDTAKQKIRARKQLDCVLDKSGVTSLSKARGNMRMEGTK